MAQRRYFTTLPSDPKPLIATCSRRVRFEEIDLMRILWHGRYASYFEDGREAFGDQYGLSYSFFMKKKIRAPLTQLHIDYKSPLTFGDQVTIETRLHFSEAMRLDFSYRIFPLREQTPDQSAPSSTPHPAATGYTVQLLIDEEGKTHLTAPEWIETFRTLWKEGKEDQIHEALLR